MRITCYVPFAAKMFAGVLCLCGLIVSMHGQELDDSVGYRIVNGENVQPGELPFQVSLRHYFGMHFCGGSVVNAWYVLTAAHCMQGPRRLILPQEIQVVAGSVDLKEPFSIHYGVAIKIHEFYNPKDFLNDIAVVKVHRQFQFSFRIMPVLLPLPHEIIPTNTSAVVSGWGNLVSVYPDAPDILQKATIFVADQEYCRRTNHQQLYNVHFTNICAYDPNVRRGQCPGDSGGPLTIGWKIIGIVSRSAKVPKPLCASTKYPGIYTRVSEYVDWITANIEDEWVWN